MGKLKHPWFIICKCLYVFASAQKCVRLRKKVYWWKLAKLFYQRWNLIEKTSQILTLRAPFVALLVCSTTPKNWSFDVHETRHRISNGRPKPQQNPFLFKPLRNCVWKCLHRKEATFVEESTRDIGKYCSRVCKRKWQKV